MAEFRDRANSREVTCEIIGVGPTKLHYMEKAGEIVGIKVGSRKLFLDSEIDRFLAVRQAEADAARAAKAAELEQAAKAAERAAKVAKRQAAEQAPRSPPPAKRGPGRPKRAVAAETSAG